SQRWNDVWLSPDRLPLRRFSTLMSSSRSGQWIPSPPPMRDNRQVGGHRRPEGSGCPLEGSGCPLEGNGHPLEGNSRPLGGSDRPLEGNDCPLQGNDRPLEGNNCPLQGNDRPLEGNNCPLEGNGRPPGGNGCPPGRDHCVQGLCSSQIGAVGAGLEE